MIIHEKMFLKSYAFIFFLQTTIKVSPIGRRTRFSMHENQEFKSILIIFELFPDTEYRISSFKGL